MCSPCARALLGLDNQWKYGFLTQDSFLCDLLVTLVIKQKAWIKRAENELLKKKKTCNGKKQEMQGIVCCVIIRTSSKDNTA